MIFCILTANTPLRFLSILQRSWFSFKFTKNYLVAGLRPKVLWGVHDPLTHPLDLQKGNHDCAVDKRSGNYITTTEKYLEQQLKQRLFKSVYVS